MSLIIDRMKESSELMYELIKIKKRVNDLYENECKHDMNENAFKSKLNFNNQLIYEFESKMYKINDKNIKLNEMIGKHEYMNAFEPKTDLKTNELIEKKGKQNKCNEELRLLSESKQSIDGNDRQFSCDWSKCGKGFKSMQSLYQHKRCVHLKRQSFQCNECQNRFFSESNLLRHKRIHSGIRPFVCHYNNCNKRFADQSHLWEHIRRHLNSRVFKCDYEECDKRFVTKSDLNRHKRIHLAYKPFVCTNCDKSFTQKHSLDRHIRRHLRISFI